MHRFFAEKIGEQTAVLLPEEEAHALKVLRMEAGDECQAIIGGRLFSARLETAESPARLQLLSELPSPEPSVRVTLYQGLPKSDKMDLIAQKCTEAGISHIVPVLFSRCVVKWEKKDQEKKLQRWQRIAAEAAKQSGRAMIPQIGTPLTVSALCGEIRKHELTLVPWEEEKGNGMRSRLSGQREIALVIGPEGGIDRDEIERMTEAGAVPVTLGPRILRTETAGLAALVSLLTLTGDME